jgi:3-hydroxyanthranilate 3,4-dioxygenase
MLLLSRLSPALRAGARASSSAALPRATHVATWIRENEASFAPPVMNKLMHREQLSIMFVGGPNEREDFHLEEGSEFFYQLRGNMQLPTVQAGKRELVTIREGDVYLLPSRIPHSPQRPEPGSIGLVVERQRAEDEPPDGLRWYTDFQACDRVLWEKYFHCYDLGKDLAPIVAEYNASEEKRTKVPSATSVVASPPLTQDTTTVVPAPFSLQGWLDAHADELAAGASLNLFEGHPDGEFDVRVVGGASVQRPAAWRHETWLHQLRGDAAISMSGGTVQLDEGACVVVPGGVEYTVERAAGSLGLVVTNDPAGNKRA